MNETRIKVRYNITFLGRIFSGKIEKGCNVWEEFLVVKFKKRGCGVNGKKKEKSKDNLGFNSENR